MSPRRGFGATWWGQAWVDALEDRAQIDANRLPRGRTYARHDHVLALVIDRGEVRAPVAGARPTPYRVTIRVRTFSDDEWDRVLDAIVARAGHAAALLDGELHPGIHEDALSAGVELLPSAGELRPRCTCPDTAEPCKHAIAVAYLVADRLDEDPFELLTLRGRGRERVIEDLRGRRQALAGPTLAAAPPADAERPPTDDPSPEPTPDRGVVASDAWAAGDRGVPPAPAALRPQPGHPAPWPVDPPSAAPFTGDSLRLLAADAARRAWALTAGTGDGGLRLSVDHDLARRAADLLGTPAWDQLVESVGARPADLTRKAVAWRRGGAGGVDVSVQPRWRPDPLVMARGRDALTAASRRAARVTDDRVTDDAGAMQLRYGRDERWYRFEKHHGRWELAGPGSDDPADAADPA